MVVMTMVVMTMIVVMWKMQNMCFYLVHYEGDVVFLADLRQAAEEVRGAVVVSTLSLGMGFSKIIGVMEIRGVMETLWAIKILDITSIMGVMETLSLSLKRPASCGLSPVWAPR